MPIDSTGGMQWAFPHIQQTQITGVVSMFSQAKQLVSEYRRRHGRWPQPQLIAGQLQCTLSIASRAIEVVQRYW